MSDTTWSFAECTHGGAGVKVPMKNIYSNTQESHNCSDLFTFQAVARILQLQLRLDGQIISRYETVCVLPAKTKTDNVTVSISIKKTRARAFFTCEHLHSGLVRAGSQTALLCTPPLCWILSWLGLHTAPDAPLHVRSVQTPRIWLWLFLEGPAKQMWHIPENGEIVPVCQQKSISEYLLEPWLQSYKNEKWLMQNSL